MDWCGGLFSGLMLPGSTITTKWAELAPNADHGQESLGVQVAARTEGR